MIIDRSADHEKAASDKYRGRTKSIYEPWDYVDSELFSNVQ